jgi:abl interactor 2
MFRSLRGSTAAKNAPPPTVYTPPAFAGKKAASFAPPPVRRVSASAPASVAPAPEPEGDAQPEWAEEEEAEEWAEALYEYTSEVCWCSIYLS